MPSLVSIFHRLKRYAPASKQLAADALIRRLTGEPEPEIRFLSRFVCRTAVDVGANSGSYTFALARFFNLVIAFEPNPGASRQIASASLPNVRLENVALSSKEGKAVLKLPIVKGIALDGWAALDRNNLSSESVDIEVRTARLDDYGLTDVNFIKIDVEGHELDVLDGAINTITACRPVCLIEGNPVSLSRFFEPLGYSTFKSWNNVTLSPQNVLLIPCQN
jgi:FkbM family methyltransferase